MGNRKWKLPVFINSARNVDKMRMLKEEKKMSFIRGQTVLANVLETIDDGAFSVVKQMIVR